MVAGRDLVIVLPSSSPLPSPVSDSATVVLGDPPTNFQLGDVDKALPSVDKAGAVRGTSGGGRKTINACRAAPTWFRNSSPKEVSGSSRGDAAKVKSRLGDRSCSGVVGRSAE